MPNPLVQQGTLNRLIASMLIPSFPHLNVTPPYLGDEGIGLTLQGETTTFINTLTGAVTSPEPYQAVTVTVHLLKTQTLGIYYKNRMEDDSRIGDVTVWSDSRVFPAYQLMNCAIQSVAEMRMNGKDAGFRLTIGGYYFINNALWDE